MSGGRGVKKCFLSLWQTALLSAEGKKEGRKKERDSHELESMLKRRKRESKPSSRDPAVEETRDAKSSIHSETFFLNYILAAFSFTASVFFNCFSLSRPTP
jgi:hypothetical protein